jgi:hypothetical protein
MGFMGRKSKTQQLLDSTLGQHLALSVAAHLARTQLVPDPLTVYDGQHMMEMLDIVGNALSRVAPLYVMDAAAGAPRQLMEAELDGARVKRGATVLVLKDGRSLSGVSIKRVDLRQAIAILKTVGIEELGPRQPAQPPKAAEPDPVAAVHARIGEIESLLRPPLVPAQVQRANSLLLSIARHASQGRVANVAMRLMSAVHDARGDGLVDERQIQVLTSRLRAALEENKSP